MRINQSEILPYSGFLTCASGLENKRFMPSFPRPQNSRVFFSKSVKKSVKRGVRVYFSLVPVLSFDCSRVLENAKIRTVLQSTPSHERHNVYFRASSSIWTSEARTRERRASTFHDIPQMESLLAGYPWKRYLCQK